MRLGGKVSYGAKDQATSGVTMAISVFTPCARRPTGVATRTLVSRAVLVSRG